MADKIDCNTDVYQQHQNLWLYFEHACLRIPLLNREKSSENKMLILSHKQYLVGVNKLMTFGELKVMTNLKKLIFFFYPAFTTVYEFEPPHFRGSEITRKDAPQSVGLPLDE